MRAKNQRRTFDRLSKPLGRTLLNGGLLRAPKCRLSSKTVSPLATPVVIADENIFWARWSRNAICAVIIYREFFQNVVVE